MILGPCLYHCQTRIACASQVSESGSSRCYEEVAEDGTLVGLYLLIAGIFLVIFTLAYVILQKRCRTEVGAGGPPLPSP